MRWLVLGGMLALPAHANGQVGRVVGRVLGSGTSEPLASAQVFLEGTSVGALTEADGRYALGGVPAGLHDVRVQLIGYASRTVAVAIVEGRTTILDIVLEPEAVALEGVVVTSAAQRGSTAALLTERRRAPVLSDAVGAEQMARTAGGSAGAALRRVPGVSVVDGRFAYVRGLGERYGATTLDGAPLASPVPDRKVIPLDVIPSGLLQSIVTAKSFSPEQPGDHAGGLVQLRTRDFPPDRILSLSLSGGWSSTATFRSGPGYAGGSRDFTGFDDGTRDLPTMIPRDVPVTPSNFSDAELQRIGRGFRGGWGPTRRSLPPNAGAGLTFGDELDLGGERRLGFIASLSWASSRSVRRDLVERVYSAGSDVPGVDYTGEVGEQSVTLGGLASLTFQPRASDRIKVSVVYNRLTDDVARVLTGFNQDSNTDQWNSRIQYLAQSLRNTRIEGEHLLDFLGGATVGWRAGLTRAGRYEPSTREALYREFGGRFYWDDFIQSGSVFHQDMVDEGWNGGLSLRVPFELAGREATLGVGASTDRKDRETYTRRFRFRPQAGGTIDDDVRARSPDELFGGSGHLIAPDAFEIREATFRTDNYDARQTVDAVYAMLDAEPIEGLRLSGGARVERTLQSVSPRDLWPTGLGAVGGARARSTDVLPALNATLALGESMNVRAGASRTLARAELRELAPFSFADYAGGFLVIGNPRLERARITNLDLRWEWFPDARSVLAVSGFYKRFARPIEVSVLPSSELIKTWVNAGEADNRGVEIEARSGLGVLGDALAPLEVQANLTLVGSEVRTGRAIDVYLPGTGPTTLAVVSKSRPLQGQSPYVANLGLTWDAGGASASLLFHRFGRRIDAVGGQGTADIHEEARSQLDAVLEIPLPSGWEAKLSASRLLGNEVEYTQEGRTVRAWDAGRSVSLSLRWAPAR